MNEIILHDYGFSTIPQVAEKEFLKLMNDWYEFTTEDGELPVIMNNMLDHKPGVSDVWSNFFYEIRAYNYAIGIDNNIFPKNVFPIDDQTFLDFRLDEQQAYYDVSYEMQFSFFEDMKKYLDANRMFYKDCWDYAYGDEMEVKYRNVPIREVW